MESGPARETCTLVQVGHARIEHLGGDHHRGRLVGVRHHGIDLGLCRHGLGFCGARRGHRRVRVGHRRIRRRLRGFGIGHRRCLIGHGCAGSSLRLTGECVGSAHCCGCIGLGLCDRRRCRFCRRRRQGDLADAGDPQLVAAGVLQGAGVADPAHLDVGDGEGSRRHEGQPGLGQSHGIGEQLAHRSVDRLHRGAGAAGVLEQSGVGLTAVHDVGDVDGVRTGQGDLHVGPGWPCSDRASRRRPSPRKAGRRPPSWHRPRPVPPWPRLLRRSPRSSPRPRRPSPHPPPLARLRHRPSPLPYRPWPRRQQPAPHSPPRPHRPRPVRPPPLPLLPPSAAG